MIDWENSKPDDFEIQVKGEDVAESGPSLIFPVMVYHKNGELAFSHSVPIRADFYRELKKKAGWRQDIMTIFSQRVRDEVVHRLKKNAVAIEDKMDLLKIERKSLNA